MARLSFGCRVFACSLLATAGAGCQRKVSPPAQSELTVVPVSRPVTRDIVDSVYYTGRIDAVQSVDIRSRVTGYIVKLPFWEGAEVKAGDLLFEIDPRPYQADYDAYKAQVEMKDASYRLARSENSRSKAIARNTAGSISNEELEKSLTQEAQALAELNLAKANMSLAKLNLDFTKITSPIDGHVSRFFLTLGNLVTQDQTLLTTVVSVDPMYVFYDMDERTVLRIRKGINEGKIPVAKDAADLPVYLGLEGEEGYPHEGRHNFVNNVVNLSTGTITVRGIFPNPKPPNGRRLLTPGQFVRVRFPIGRPHPALLVIDRALGSDQGLKFVYVLDSKNRVQYRRVKVGSLQDDGLRAIEEGVNADDWVVVGAIPQIRPLMHVEPERIPMPTLETMTAKDTSPSPPSTTQTPAAAGGSASVSPPDTKPLPPPGKTKR